VDGGVVGTGNQVNNRWLGSWTADLNDIAFFLEKEEELEKDQAPSADGETNRAPADEETKQPPAVEAKENKDPAPNEDKKEEDRKDDSEITWNHGQDEDRENDEAGPRPARRPGLLGAHPPPERWGPATPRCGPGRWPGSPSRGSPTAEFVGFRRRAEGWARGVRGVRPTPGGASGGSALRVSLAKGGAPACYRRHSNGKGDRVLK